MKTASVYGAFNARWLEPEDVARTFVPTLPFKGLVHLQNSLLMGPRGCGKTTLLKMLTRRAQAVWQEERLPKEPWWRDYAAPDFEAVYIPSDVRWSAELNSLSKELQSSPLVAERAQRTSVSISAVQEATRVFEAILEENEEQSIAIAKALISNLNLGACVPSFRDIRLKISRWVDDIHAHLITKDIDRLTRFLDSLPSTFVAHALSAVTAACVIFTEHQNGFVPSRWALCFDELEIAPRWLQTELFSALRSFDQRFLLKLTWSPVLPTDLMPYQERQHDYLAIRMWHGHVADARPFCKEFTTRILRDRLDGGILPSDVFGPSPFAQDDLDSEETYSRGAQIWRIMRDLAVRDSSFRDYLLQHKISPEDPITESIAVRDESLRKVKPIALLRDAYLKEDGERLVRRSRKNPLLYFGEDAIYAMSEGNPRLLAGLLNELLDVGIKTESRYSKPSTSIRPEVQSRVLHAASQRLLTGIRTYPIQRESERYPLKSIIDRLGNYLHSELVASEFKADPVGSFFIDQDAKTEILNEISIGLLIGAFVPVKTVQADEIPSSIIGSRIRLSYMLAPYYGLLFRNYREMRLSTALRISEATQRHLFRSDRRYTQS